MNILKQIRKEISPELLKLRHEKGLSLYDVALSTGLTAAMVEATENGSKLIEYRVYCVLAWFYHKRIDVCLEDLEDE